jgi:hypothetical protein
MVLTRQPDALSKKSLVKLLAVLLFFAPAIAFGADLSFSPSSSSHAVGETFSIKITVNPGSDSINAADGTASYDTALLSLQSFSKEGSVFSLWTSEPTISAADGTLDFSGGTPSAFSTAGTILTLKFKALKVGTAKLSFTKGSVLAADGKGTNVYGKGNDGSVEITAAAAPPPPPPPPPDAAPDSSTEDTGPPPPAPIVDSPTFPKPDNWYATSTGMFTWNVLPDVTGVRIVVSDSDSATPSNELKGAATSTVVSGLKDGVSYFIVQFKNGSGWGDIAKRKVQIDTVPPKPFNVALESAKDSNDTAKFSFKAEDDLSGIDHYQLLLGSTSVATIAAKDISDGTYPVPPQDGGSQKVTVRAYDMAGNMTESSNTLTLPKVAKPKADASGTTPPPASGGSIFERVLLIIFAFVIGGLFAWMRFTRKKDDQYKAMILQRIAEAREKNDRVFSAMREEFEQQINDFDKKPQLTPEERDLLENIKEVLDISEEVIDSGMDELKKAARAEAA